MPLRVQEGVPIPVSAEPPPPDLEGGTVGPNLFDTASFGGPLSNKVAVRLFRQGQLDRLCWAACAMMVLDFLGISAELCEVASVIKGNQCCNDIFDCNSDCQAEDVGTVYEEFGVDFGFDDDPVTFDVLKTQINSNKPLEVGISWGPNNGGHLIVVHGWSVKPHGRFVKIHDPIDGTGEVAFSDLLQHYTESDGRWTHTWIGFRV